MPPGTRPTPGRAAANRALIQSLRALAAYGLTKGEPRSTTIARMVAYIRYVKPTAAGAQSLAQTTYDAVLNKPTSTWSELITNPIASWQQGIDNVVKPFANVLDALGAVLSGALWLRVVLALGGVVLLAIGLKLLLGQLAGGAVGSVVKAVAK